MTSMTTVGRAGALGRLLASGRLRAVYQPIIDLDTQAPVAYEALVRGPQGSPLESPAALFGQAAAAGLLSELDRAARAAAIDGALAAGLRPPHTLFLNVEPSTLDGSGPLIDAGELRIVVELTERALAARPAEVLAAVGWLRERGCGIALDDVGIDERSLALMPFLAPDVIKLDMSLIQERRPSRRTARVLNAVAAEAERSGATLLAEGVETDAHLARAHAVGATLAQGWYFGRPGELPPPAAVATGAAVALRGGVEPTQGVTPFELIADRRRLRRGDKRLLLALSRQLENEALGLGGEAVVLATFQDARFFSTDSRAKYERLAESAALVGALGCGLEAEPAPCVRGADLDADEALRGEWDVAVISPHFAGAFVARDLGDDCADADRSFDYFVTYERELVVAAARTLMARIVAR